MKPNTKHILIHVVFAVILFLPISTTVFGQASRSFHDFNFRAEIGSLADAPLQHFTRDITATQQGTKPARGDSNVTLIGRWAWGPVGGGAVRDSFVYIGNGDLFQILGVSNPYDPQIVGEILTPYMVGEIILHEQYAYIVSGGLRMIDITDPTNPIYIGGIDISCPMSLAISGDYAYVGDQIPGVVHIIDISTPSNPVEIGWILGPGEFINALAVIGDTLCIGSEEAFEIEFYDVSDPENAVYIGSYMSGPTTEVRYSNGLMYVGVRWPPYFRIFDLSRPLWDIEVGSLDRKSIIYGIAVLDSLAFLANKDGIYVVDISRAAHPEEVSHIDKREAYSIDISGNYAYASAKGLWIVDISSLHSLEEVSHFPTGGYAYDVDQCGNYAYLADGFAGLWVIDVSDPTFPKSIGNFPTQGFTFDVTVSGRYVYLTNAPYSPEDTTGLWIIDMSDVHDPASASFIEGEYAHPRVSNDPALLGTYLFLVKNDSGLSIIDISEPTEPYEVSFTPSEGRLRGIDVSDNIAYMAENGLVIVDVSDPINPIEVGSLPGTYPFGVKVANNIAYLGANAGLLTVDVSDPTKPKELGYVHTPGGRSSIDISVSGSYAYLAYGIHMIMIDVSSPANPRVVGWIESPRGCYGVTSDERYIYLANSNGGLLLYQNIWLQGKKGDVNKDGSIDVTDVTRIIHIIVKFLPEPTAYELWASDNDENGLINVLDIVQIVNLILGH
jgi:hypothetical protein